jgi:hypothetical protein
MADKTGRLVDHDALPDDAGWKDVLGGVDLGTEDLESRAVASCDESACACVDVDTTGNVV